MPTDTPKHRLTRRQDFPRRWPATLVLLLPVCCAWMDASLAVAGAVVVANRTDAPIRFGVSPDGGKQQAFTLDPSGVTPVEVTATGVIAFHSGGEPRYYRVESGSIYFFHGKEASGLELEQIGLPRTATAEKPTAELPPLATVPIKVLVDDDEQAVQSLWQGRLRKRIEQANAVMEHHCRVRFEINEFATWESDRTINQYERSLADFEKKVRPGAATIAIGFTSQYRRPERGSRAHLGGIRGPFRRHILIREWPQHFSEPERLEVLVHELGHFLGAVHSPEKSSVMRPDLGDRQANDRQFRIGFDPVNP